MDAIFHQIINTHKFKDPLILLNFIPEIGLCIKIFTKQSKIACLKHGLFRFIFVPPPQGWGAGAVWSRVFLAPWSRSRLKIKSGAGAATKLAGSSALR